VNPFKSDFTETKESSIGLSTFSEATSAFDEDYVNFLH